MSSEHLRIGFIGASPGAGPWGGSWAARAHMPYLKSDRNSSYSITALQNSSKASAERAAKELQLHSVKAHYDNPEELANDPSVDLVAVSVKVPLHYDCALPALKAGKDVFVEWPLARNVKEAEELTNLAKKNGVRTLVGLQARHNPSVVRLKKLVDEGELGDILSTTMHGYGMIFGATNPQDFSYGFPIEAGANLVTIPFGHAIDALCWVLGELEYVGATLLNKRPTFPVTDNDGKQVGEATKTAHDLVSINGTLQKSGGLITAIYEGGMNPSGGPSFVWQVNGTKGIALLEGPVGHLQMFQPKLKFGKVGEEINEVKDIEWVDNDFSYAVGEAWSALVGKGQGTVTTFEDALLRHKMIEAIYRSNESGKRERYL